MECKSTGKLQIDNEPLARLILERLKKSKKEARKERNIYQCESCGCWHFTKGEIT